MTSSVIYYSTEARKNEIHLLSTVQFDKNKGRQKQK